MARTSSRISSIRVIISFRARVGSSFIAALSSS
jgi:hypothetical protein